MAVGDEASGHPWSTPFVGRHRELAALTRQFDEAARGRCAIVLLSGEPGIGKTRIAEELCEPAPLAPTQACFHLFDSIVRVLERKATQPLVPVLDDLHWADEPSLLLLEFVGVHLADAPILIVGSYRDVELAPGHALSTTLGGLARRPRVQRIALGRLSPAEVAEPVEATPGVQPAGRLVQAILDRAEGNPLQRIAFGSFQNAKVTIGHQTIASGQTYTVPAGVVFVGFTVERATPGQATTVPFTVAGGRGEWQSLVGGGTAAGF
jgi:predicted ATPase